MNIVLIGYRGSGKTHTGRQLAELLQWAFVDTDRLIETSAGKSIRQIFDDDGEAHFRDLETAAIDATLQTDQQVIALGGGAVLRPENRSRIQHNSLVVWLKADPATLLQRIEGDADSAATRPALTSLGNEQEIEHLLNQREPLYREVCDLELDSAGQSPADLAAAIGRQVDQA